MNRSQDSENRWGLWYAIPGIVLATLLLLQALGAVEYTESTLITMATTGAAVLLLVAIVHYAAVYRGEGG